MFRVIADAEVKAMMLQYSRRTLGHLGLWAYSLFTDIILYYSKVSQTFDCVIALNTCKSQC